MARSAGSAVVPAAQHVALVDDGGDDARQRRRAARDHAGQPGVHRQPDHRAARAAVIAPSASSAPSSASSSSACRAGLGRRRVDERQLLGRRAPRGELEHEPGQVDLGDLGRPVGRAGAVLHPAPQPVGDARARPPGPPGALVGRVAADRHGRQPGHPGADVEARRPGQPAVDDDPHAVDGQRRLGDVGRQHDAAPAGR